MAKPKMYGSVKQYIPNNTADQRKKRFKRKSRQRKSGSGMGAERKV
jgi:hypothetical protein